MRWEQKNWRKEWDKQMKTHPETLYPDYDILVNSKPYFLYNATQISLFQKGEKEQLFVWVDAGYGHGSQSAIPLGIWSPNKINNEQITIIKLPTHGERVERYTIERVYRKHRSVISGGFLAGGEKIIRRFWTFFMKTFLELLDQRIVDDDQTTLLITIQRYNSTFNLLKGNWFDAFKLLPSKN
uniref:DDE Tnp4 domain-containing protein n=1 Tax=Meloidogyne hapla TaxID=6305 RepID=A0A1I8B520_MELHA